MDQYSPDNFHALCDSLAQVSPQLGAIITDHGYPPCWQRPLNYQHLVLVILEQQVSLASAKHAHDKLEQKVGEILPEKLILLSDTELRACGFSRQKSRYSRALATAIINKQISLQQLPQLPDDEVRSQLMQIPGIGPWTANVVLLMMLNRLDIFPVGDLALRNSIKSLLNLPKDTSHKTLLEISQEWKPLRSIASMLLWHRYLGLRS